MAGKPLAHRGTGGTSLTSEDDAVPDIDTNNVCEGASISPVSKFFLINQTHDSISLQTSGLLLERLQGEFFFTLHST